MTWWDGGIDLAPYGGSAPQPNAGVYINNTAADVYDAYSATWTAASAITRTNLTVGNGTEVCRWFAIGGRVHVMYSLTFGSTTALDASLHPAVDITDYTGGTSTGMAGACDSGIGIWYPTALYGSDDGASIYAHATYPFTWTTGDVLAASWTDFKLPPDYTP